MRVVVPTDEGQLELAYMWLPTFIGMNNHIKEVVEKELKEAFVGQPMNEATLDAAHTKVVELLEKKFTNVKGLGEFLDGLKFVFFE